MKTFRRSLFVLAVLALPWAGWAQTQQQQAPKPPAQKPAPVTLDPALLVTPPKGLEVGYVPIVTHQEATAPAAKAK